MFLPWLGLFEQAGLANVFMHYDDVQLPQGRSFVSRVQIKMTGCTRWLTAPIDRSNSGRIINRVILVEGRRWRDSHLETLKHAYAKAPYAEHMLKLAEEIYDYPNNQLSDFNINAIELLASWLGLKPQFCRSSNVPISGTSSERLVRLCQHVGATTYVTGHGASRYLDHELFERARIEVRYMNYQVVSYPQLNGVFTPYVTILDAIANCGPGVRDLMRSTAVYWKDSDLFRRRPLQESAT